MCITYVSISCFDDIMALEEEIQPSGPHFQSPEPGVPTSASKCTCFGGPEEGNADSEEKKRNQKLRGCEIEHRSECVSKVRMLGIGCSLLVGMWHSHQPMDDGDCE